MNSYNKLLSNKKIYIVLIIVFLLIIILFLYNKNRLNKLSVSNPNISLEIGESTKIILNSKIDVIYKSNDTTIATVDDNGIIKAQNYGKTTITISAKNSDKRVDVNVNVLDNISLKVNKIDTISSNNVSKEYVKKDDKIIIKITFNQNLNIKPQLFINNNEIDYQYDDKKDNIVIERIVQEENELILSIYINNQLIYTQDLFKVDNQIPTCTLKYENEYLKITGEDNYGINGYAISKSQKYVYSLNQELKVNEYGTWYGYIRDYAGNEGVCTIDINKPLQEIDPTMITIIGDSRMEDLCRRSWYKQENGSCVAKTSKGYSWLISTAIPEVNNLSSNKRRYIVTNLGVNDLANAKRYVSKYEELALSSWKESVIFLLSVNPTKDKYDHLNSDINSFNNELIQLASKYDNISYCDSNSYLKKIGFQSNDGLHYTQSTDKEIYAYIKKCISDFYS